MKSRISLPSCVITWTNGQIIPDYAVLGMGSEDMRQHIHKIELIGKDPEDGDISIYLFEVRSVTAKFT